MIAKYLATSFAIEKVVSAPRVISICLPVSTTSMSFVGFESRSTMLPASFAACVPLFIATATSACASAGRVVRAVAGHRDEAALRLVFADQLELRLRRRFGEEVVDARFGGDRRSGQPVVAGDHHGLDAHAAQLGEALLDAAFHDVLQLDHAEHARPVRDDERRGAPARDGLDQHLHLARKAPAQRLDVRLHRLGGAFADLPAFEVDAAHSRLRREWDEASASDADVALRAG